MDLLSGKMRHYPWGSRDLIAQLQGQSHPTERPEAELWFGAHPAGSAAIDGTPLVELIVEDPIPQLGQRSHDKWGSGLPFLLKLLAAAEPLSLQAHPSLDQAREGFARENAEGIPLTADNRNYKDDNHKPELIVALTEFELMAGFRPLQDTLALLQQLSSSEVDRYACMLDTSPESESDDLRVLFTTWITIPSASRQRLIGDIATSAALALGRPDLPEWMREALTNVVDLHDRYPFDVGVLGALLLNKFTLEPGEAVYLDAGQLHAYVKGLGVEIMANSDNVLRGGLTSKHVDVPELVRVLKFESLDNPRITAHHEGYRTEFPTPAEEFTLTKYDLGPDTTSDIIIDHDGPVIALLTRGKADFVGEGKEIAVTAGGAVWIPAADGPVKVRATDAELFVASS